MGGQGRAVKEGGTVFMLAFSLMPCLPGKKHKEGGKERNEDTEIRALLCFLESGLPVCAVVCKVCEFKCYIPIFFF